MDLDISPQRALKLAIGHLLRPLFRVLLRNAVSYGAFEEIAKRVYVQVTLDDFGIPGKKPSISRASILSGLTRKEVQRLLSEPAELALDTTDRYNRAARVLTAWGRDPDFLDAAGQPLALAPDAFAALVKRHSGDMPARAVRDELVRVGAVQEHDDGRLAPLTGAYVPQDSPVDKIGILGTDVADLVDTIDHNLQHGSDDPRFQRKVMYHSIPVESLPAFRKLSATQAQALLEKFDRWLAEHDTDFAPAAEAPARARVGVGIYYFEQALEPSDGQGEPA
ncbi:MAG TPA: DUF6502 family protein [Albitalea sp.]|uniref:DUF6502 family protein n=1 Tax=Piscinibacter sp. TaxID=1903157 RepID=UPI002ED438C0